MANKVFYVEKISNSYGIGFEIRNYSYNIIKQFYGYTIKDAIKQFRINNGLRYKHIKFIIV